MTGQPLLNFSYFVKNLSCIASMSGSILQTNAWNVYCSSVRVMRLKENGGYILYRTTYYKIVAIQDSLNSEIIIRNNYDRRNICICIIKMKLILNYFLKIYFKYFIIITYLLMNLANQFPSYNVSNRRHSSWNFRQIFLVKCDLLPVKKTTLLGLPVSSVSSSR